jgi:hypothetical protein
MYALLVLPTIFVCICLYIVTTKIRILIDMALMTARWLGTFVTVAIKIPALEALEKLNRT